MKKLKTVFLNVMIFVTILGTTHSVQATCGSTEIQTPVTDGTTELNKTLWDDEFNNVYDCIDEQVQKSGDTMTGDLKMNDNKLYLDGGSSSDTYLKHQPNNQIDFATGGSVRFSVSNSGVFFEGSDAKLASGKKLYLDGGGDTYLFESSANKIDFNVGGATVMNLSNSGVFFEGSDVKVAATKKLYLDGGTHTYLSETSGDDFSIFVGGSERLRMAGSNEVYLPQGLSTNSGAKEVRIDSSSGKLYRESSSRKYKKNINKISNELNSDVLYKMKGVMYSDKSSDKNVDQNRRYVGFIAEDIFKVAPQLTYLNVEGKPDGVMYSRIVVLLVEEIKNLKNEIEELKKIKEEI